MTARRAERIFLIDWKDADAQAVTWEIVLLHRAGHRDAAASLCASSRGLISNALRRWGRIDPGSGMTGDLWQQGYLAILETADTWDPAKGQFSTHAHYRLHRRITQHRLEQRAAVRTPQQTYGRERARARGKAVPAPRQGLETYIAQCFSIDTDTYHRGWDGGERSFADILRCDPFEEVDEELDAESRAAACRALVALLELRVDKRQWDILWRRARGELLDQIGPLHGICRERVRQLEVEGERACKQIVMRALLEHFHRPWGPETFDAWLCAGTEALLAQASPSRPRTRKRRRSDRDLLSPG